MKEYTEKYTNKGLISSFLIRNYFQSVKELISRIPWNDTQNRIALEVGCGSGYSTKELIEMLPRNVRLIASDYEEENVADAKKHLNNSIEIVQEDVYSLKKDSKSIDLIFLLEVMEHLENPVKAIEELKRVGRDYLIVGVPNEPLWRFMNMVRFKYWGDLGNTPGHIQHWSSKMFIQFLKEQDLEVVAVEKPIPWTLVLLRIKNES